MNAAELQILGSRLASVADEMGAVLRRAAFSPNIKERADCSAALFTADGELLTSPADIVFRPVSDVQCDDLQRQVSKARAKITP